MRFQSGRDCALAFRGLVAQYRLPGREHLPLLSLRFLTMSLCDSYVGPFLLDEL
jgi:hypothetical protein